MPNARFAPLPIDHLLAETAAYPLATEASFRIGLCSLEPLLRTDDARRLWRAAEQELLRACSGVSIDELVALRDDLWFYHQGTAEDSPRPLHAYVAHIAQRFLRSDGVVAYPLAPTDGPVDLAAVFGRQAWRWLSLALPPDLLLAALGGPASRVEPVSPILRQQLLDGGFAEVHVHRGATLQFPAYWTGLLRAVADPAFTVDTCVSPGAAFDDGAELGSWLLRAALARYWLAMYIYQRSPTSTFRDFYHDHIRRAVRSDRGISDELLVDHALQDLIVGALPNADLAASPNRDPWFHALQSVYRSVSGVTRFRFDGRDGTDLEHLDSVSTFLPNSTYHPEMAFVIAGLRYTREHPHDRLFATLFWQITRVRGLVYRHVVQRPLTPGLQWFVRFYNRAGAVRKLVDPNPSRISPVSETHRSSWVDAALDAGGRDCGLRALELRVGPEPRMFDGLLNICDLERHAESAAIAGSGDPVIELGLVIHVARDRGGNAIFKGRPAARWQATYADPGFAENTSGYRYAHYYRDQRERASATARVLLEYPLSVEWIRGFDACTDEVGVPTWVVAPLLRYMGEAGELAAQVASRNRRVPPPGKAVHAGEDFVHLLSGLRRLHESVVYFGLREGDRIGHGLALALEPVEWARRAGRVALPVEERLMDLVWEWSRHTTAAGPSLPHRLPFVEREIAGLSERLFGSAVSAQRLQQLTERLHNEEFLGDVMGFPDGPVGVYRDRAERRRGGGALNCYLLELRYLTDRSVFIRGKETVWVDVASEAESIAALQRAVRDAIGRRGILIEVNPSSNLLVAHMSGLDDHPLWRLKPIVPDPHLPSLPICVGSDDPLTFATTLPQEYQLLYDQMIINGIPAADARRWLADVRSTSLEARFTVPRSGDRVTDSPALGTLKEPRLMP